MAGGMVKDIEMRLKFDGVNCDIKIYWYPSDNFNQNAVALMVSNLLDVVKCDPVLQSILGQSEIRKFDTNGNPIDYNLKEAVIKAIDEFPTGDRIKGPS